MHEGDKDHLFGAIVKDAEVGLMVLVKAVYSVVINTSQSVYQLPEIFMIFFDNVVLVLLKFLIKSNQIKTRFWNCGMSLVMSSRAP